MNLSMLNKVIVFNGTCIKLKVFQFQTFNLYAVI